MQREMGHKVTIRDVAREAGTSVSTVSRVLTGRARVSEAKRRAVQKAITRLGFRPSQIARSLKTNVTRTVGLLINDITNPFYAALARGAGEEAARHGYSLILCNTGDRAELELQYLHVLRDKQVDGIIFGPCGDNLEDLRELARYVPLVQVDRRLPDLATAAVVTDNEGGAYQAVRHLISRGHRRIGLLSCDLRITTLSLRAVGYTHALQEAGLPLDPSLKALAPNLEPAGTRAAAQQLLELEPRPSAILALNNQLGLGALQAIREARLRMPRDVALMVFDDLDLFALVSPTVSAISQPAYALGQRAMECLVGRIEDAGERLPEVIVLPVRLMLRESA
jgi:DNA-binding LacI/PurR family transcriptional regulator